MDHTEENQDDAAGSDDAASEGAGLDATGPSDASIAPEASVAPEEATPAKPDVEAEPYKPSYVFLVVVTLVNLVADLWSKGWAKGTFESVRPGGERKKVVIDGFMNFIFAKNKGGAWGLLQDETEALRRPFFLIVSVAAIVFIVSLYRKLQRGQTALKWGLPLVLGGALGNLVDRIRYGYVVDFIDVYTKVPEGVANALGWTAGVKHWPTFNVADISICVGVAFMAIDMFTSREPDSEEDMKKALQEAEATDDDAPEPSLSDRVLSDPAIKASTEEKPSAG